MIGVLTAGVKLGSASLVQLITGYDGQALSSLLAIIFFGLFTPYYFLVLHRKLSQTPGQKIFGLYVVEPDGGIRGLKAALVRFTYFIMSLLFLFPLPGYLFILFSRSKQGLHDRLADTRVIMPKSIIRTISAWIVLVVLLAPAGWQSVEVFHMFHPLYLASSPMYEDLQETYLEPIWSVESDRTGSLERSLMIDDRLIAAEHLGVRALDPMTGRVLWSRDDIQYPVLHKINTGATAKHLIISYFDQEGNRFIIKGDPETGRDLFKINLELPGVQIIFDDQVLITRSRKAITAYDIIDLKPLWTRPDELPPDNDSQLWLADNLLYYTYPDNAQLLYLDKKTGKVLWNRKDIPHEPASPLPLGRQLFIDSDSHIALYHLPDYKKIWKIKAETGPKIETDAGRGQPDQNPSILYLKKKAYDIGSGRVSFSYPEKFGFIAATNDFLILSEYPLKPPSLEAESDIILVDKHDGRPISPPLALGTGFPTYITETENTIYLLLNNFSRSSEPKYATYLVKIDKSSYRTETFPIGTSIYDYNLYLFPEQNSILIVTFTSIGLYRLP